MSKEKESNFREVIGTTANSRAKKKKGCSHTWKIKGGIKVCTKCGKQG